MAARKLFAAKHSFACEHRGVEALIPEGAVVADDDPLLKAHPELFSPVEPQADLELPKPKPAKPKPRRRRAA